MLSRILARADPLALLRRYTCEPRPIVRLDRRTELVTHPAAAHLVLTADPALVTKRPGADPDGLRRFWGTSPFYADGPVWRRQRQAIAALAAARQPAAAHRAVLAAALDTRRWGHDVVLLDELGALTLEVAVAALLGTPDPAVVAAVGSLLSAVTGAKEEGRGARPHDAAVRDRLPAVEAALAAASGPALDTLRARLPDAVAVRDVLLSLLRPAAKNTATAVTWACVLLAGRRGLQERVVAEPALLRRVVAETMRLFPLYWAMTRHVAADCELGGLRLAAGSRVFVSPYLLHRRPAEFPEPARFDPGRWTAGYEAALPAGAYLPFGAGSRRCPVRRHAERQTTELLGELLRRYEIGPGARVRPRATASGLRPPEGLRFRLVERR